MPDVVPMLSYEDCAAAADWLARALGFEELERLDHEGRVAHVTLRAGDGLVYLGWPGPAYVCPRRLRERVDEVARMYEVPYVVDGAWVAVDDLDALVERARAAGARVLSGPEDSSHGRHARIEDPEGHRWLLEQRA